MENIKNTLNIAKWQILSRLPKGSIYERTLEALKNKDIDINNPFYYIYWKDLDRTIIEKYLFGTFGTSNEDYLKFITWMERFRNNEFYEIKIDNNVIKIPVPLLKDYKCFKAEFLDIIMPYLVKNIKMKQPFLEGPYEYGNVIINDNDVVFDLGANYGLFSSLASSKNCNVYAFEPTKRVVNEYLKKLETIDNNINVINKAISDTSGVSLFQVYEDKSSCNNLCDSNYKVSNESDVYNVETITIDDFVSERNLGDVDFIKTDIEGAERRMLVGAKKTLKELAPKLAICYYHNLDDLKVLRKLILDANPKYEIDVAYKKIYARVPGK